MGGGQGYILSPLLNKETKERYFPLFLLLHISFFSSLFPPLFPSFFSFSPIHPCYSPGKLPENISLWGERRKTKGKREKGKMEKGK